jgi:hypothetical protein
VNAAASAFNVREAASALDRYFQTQATQDIRRRIANCFVAVETATNHLRRSEIKIAHVPPRAAPDGTGTSLDAEEFTL